MEYSNSPPWMLQLCVDLVAKCDDTLKSTWVYVRVTLGVAHSALRAYCYFHFLEEEVINGWVGD